MWVNGIPFDSIKEIDTYKYNEFMGVAHYFTRYNMFTKAQKLGVVFNADEFDYEVIEVFELIRSSVDEGIKKANNGSK